MKLSRVQEHIVVNVVDITVGIAIAVLVIATVLFGGAVSQFVYIDF